MKPSLQKLQKFFRLEAEHGYNNRAVIGGLERILETWEAEARIDNVPEEVIQAVHTRLRDYPRLSTTSRAEALEGLWRRIQRTEPTGQPASLLATPPPSQEKPQPELTTIEASFDAQAVVIGPIDKVETVPIGPQLDEPESIGTEENVDEPTSGEATLPSEVETPVSRPDTPEGVNGPPAALNAQVTVLSGVGPRHANTLGHLGLYTLRDMLYYFPRRYVDYSQLTPINRLKYGEEVTVIGTVQSTATRPIRGGQMQLSEAVLSDGSGTLRVTWFNQPWVVRQLRNGTQVSVAGKIDQYLGRLSMTNPELEALEQQQLSTNRIVPVYPLTSGITQRWLRNLMNQVVSYWAVRVKDPLPETIRRSAGLVDLATALYQSHFPDSWERLKSARHRLAFDEILLLQLGVLRQKRAWQDRAAEIFETPPEWLELQINQLPFTLTAAQQRAIQDVSADLASGRPMNRLLQGDVGSGKTIIAALAAAIVARRGSQTALMAPTSILAEQHYKNLLKILASAGSETAEEPSAPALLSPLEIRLLVGATPEAEKREIRAGLAEGRIKLVIGTHALIEDPIGFADLQLTIVDEQHRFGVEQRAALRSKGANPHLLVMTATPIPRSLALTLYGDLDLTVIDELPPGRQVINTHVLTPLERERVYSLIRSQVSQGRQAFIIYPLVEESEKSEAKAAVEEHARLQSQVFPKMRLGLLHGRIPPEEKEEVMARFHSGEYHILVSTSVVEVGVDVPNATVMLIEGANHFGLAQLHQFRGRVGRGLEKAYCILIPDTSDSAENERLIVMTQTNDGFVLAQHDLDQRGPGQFLGTRQSGFAELQMAKLTDVPLIEKARRQAQLLFELDPNLEIPEHQPLAAELDRFWGKVKTDIS